MLKYTLFLVLALSISGSCIAQIKTGSTILDTEQRRFTAMVEKDTELLSTMLDNELQYLHSNGLYETKQQHLTAIASGKIDYQAMARQPNPIVRRYGKIALVNGLVNVNGLINGQSFSLPLRYTAVYRKKKGKWLLVNWQSTRADSK
ncbi:MAG: nuclear transport factor 2 family protein [Lewinellaceae bacterium]|nr:nuclear transport factor 2 family protein [Saprospiraceae bacterium]MCB9330438.1 nuclear transport factor 2 family protein [Lewinellaceae bacterium]